MYNAIMGFLDSNLFAALFGGLITLITGVVALVVYLKQKSDSKKDAANIILLEIQNAERHLRRVREIIGVDDSGGDLPQDTFLMTPGSWDQYKYLFVRDFDRDEWDRVSDFYNKCRQYDEAVVYNNSFFSKNEEQIRVNLQRKFAEIAWDSVFASTSLSEDEYQAKIKLFNDRYMYNQGSWIYSPKKPVLDARKYVAALDDTLSLTSVGTKLKKLAKVK